MIRNIFKATDSKTLLGRWGLNTDKMTTIKVNWANIDHCGICSKEEVQYSEYNTSNNKDNQILVFVNKDKTSIK